MLTDSEDKPMTFRQLALLAGYVESGELEILLRAERYAALHKGSDIARKLEVLTHDLEYYRTLNQCVLRVAHEDHDVREHDKAEWERDDWADSVDRRVKELSDLVLALDEQK